MLCIRKGIIRTDQNAQGHYEKLMERRWGVTYGVVTLTGKIREAEKKRGEVSDWGVAFLCG